MWLLAFATAAFACSGAETGSPAGGGGTEAPGSGGAPAHTGGGSGTSSTSSGGASGTSSGTGGSTATGGARADASPGAGGSGGGAPASDGGADASAVDAGPLDGLNIDGKCFPLCASAATDPDGDGYGYENNMSCIVAGSAPSRGRTPCATGIVRTPPGDGVQAGGVCYPLCGNASADPDGDGYGFDQLLQLTCIVQGSVAALMGSPCNTGITRPPPPTPGNGFFIGGTCISPCTNPASDPDGDGWGFENVVCIVPGSAPARMALSCAPNQTPPPPPPPGTGWNSDYTATMFGQANCAPLGFMEGTDINRSACVSRNAVTLNATNQTYFGAPGDLSTLWGTAPACVCPGGQATCVPSCNGQPDCAMCVEIACNAAGTHSFMNTGDTHNRFCRAGQSVVVQIIDACPHNHQNNTYWCTAARPNHIDISCSAFAAITQGEMVGTIGYVNAYVRPVDCSVGLGPKSL